MLEALHCLRQNPTQAVELPMACVLKGCEGEDYAAGLCSKHYNRWRMTGTFADGSRARRPFHERLWSKIDKRGPDECWEWTAKERVSGYGKIGVGGRGRGAMLAHRAVWEEINGPIPESSDYHGKVVMHTCDNRLCCNPAHLRLGTQAENVKDMDAKGRRVWAGPHGATHHKAKLTDDDIRAIRKASGSYPEIARRYGVSSKMIGYIKRGKSWRHVT